jgi:hypothetical protein
MLLMTPSAAGPPAPAVTADDPAWTIEEACAYFAAGGAPVDPDRIAKMIAPVGVPVTGRAPSAGPQGGRGKARYPLAELMRIHAFLIEADARRGRLRPDPETGGDTPGEGP